MGQVMRKIEKRLSTMYGQDELKERLGEYLLESDSCSMEQVSTTLGKYDHHLVQYILEQLIQKESKAATKDMIRNLGKGIKKNQAAFYRMKYEGNQLMKGVPARKLSHIISTRQWPK